MERGRRAPQMKWLYKVMSHLSAAVRASMQSSCSYPYSVAGTVLILTDVREIAHIHPCQNLSV